jgi:hypothetical protein
MKIAWIFEHQSMLQEVDFFNVNIVNLYKSSMGIRSTERSNSKKNVTCVMSNETKKAIKMSSPRHSNERIFVNCFKICFKKSTGGRLLQKPGQGDLNIKWRPIGRGGTASNLQIP